MSPERTKGFPVLIEAIDSVGFHDNDAYPGADVAALQEAGLPSAPFPAALDGLGASLEEATILIERLAMRSPDLALILSMPLGLAGGVYGAPLELATPEWRTAWAGQAERAARSYAQGNLYSACNSEKGAGGSLAAIKTVVARRGDGFVITGEKILASGGTNASAFFSTAKVDQADLPGAGVVEFFLVDVAAPGVTVMNDWDGFGMRATESHTVRYESAPVIEMIGFPGFLEAVRPIEYWFCLFAAIPLGCARAVLDVIGNPAPTSPAVRLRLSEALMRYESLRAYLLETARGWRHASDAAYRARVMRTKTYVSEQSVRLAAELFALGGGRHYRRNDPAARSMASAFAGTALRPPLALGLDTVVEQFELSGLWQG